MFRMRYLLPFAAVALMLTGAAPSRSETIIDEWQNVKAPPAPKLQPVQDDCIAAHRYHQADVQHENATALRRHGSQSSEAPN